MTTQEKIEAIRAACIAANPEIIKLEFGCEVRQGKKVDQIWRMTPGTSFPIGYSLVHFTGAFFPDRKDLVNKSFEILGRPIRLDDTRQIIRQEYWGELIEIWRDGLLSDQPEVVIEWIVKNIAPLD